MNLYDFLRHNHPQRASLVNDLGELLTARKTTNYSVYLYSMNQFFAEVWYRVADNQVDFVRGFTSKDLLEPYLEMMDLSAIIG